MSGNELITEIIKEQSQIIGTQLAVARAEYAGVVIHNAGNPSEYAVTSVTQDAIDKLINSYKEIFGTSSVDVCINVIKKFPPNEVTNLVSDNVKSLLNS